MTNAMPKAEQYRALLEKIKAASKVEDDLLEQADILWKSMASGEQNEILVRRCESCGVSVKMSDEGHSIVCVKSQGSGGTAKNWEDAKH